MGDFDKINLDLQQKDLATQKKKLFKNNLKDGVVGNAFSVFIEQAIAKTEQTTDGQNDHPGNNTPGVAQENKNEIQNNQDRSEKSSSPTNKTAESGTEKSEKPQKLTDDQVKVNHNSTDMENLREALAIAGKRLEQFLYINPDNRIEIKKVNSIARVSKAEAISVDNLLEEMIQNIKKAKAGN